MMFGSRAVTARMAGLQIKAYGPDQMAVADQHELVSSSFKKRQMWVEALGHALDNIRYVSASLPRLQALPVLFLGC